MGAVSHKSSCYGMPGAEQSGEKATSDSILQNPCQTIARRRSTGHARRFDGLGVLMGQELETENLRGSHWLAGSMNGA